MVRPIAGRVSAAGARAGHAGDRRCGVAEDPARDAVEPGDVGHRIHHADVGLADVGRDLAGGDGRDHQLRDSDRQRLHCGRDQRRAAGAADADDARDVRPARQEGGEGPGHLGHRRAALAGEHRGGPAGVRGRHGFRGNVGPGAAAAGGEVDDDGLQAIGPDTVAEVRELRTLGVAGSGDIDAPGHSADSFGPPGRAGVCATTAAGFTPAIYPHRTLRPQAARCPGSQAGQPFVRARTNGYLIDLNTRLRPLTRSPHYTTRRREQRGALAHVPADFGRRRNRHAPARPGQARYRAAGQARADRTVR